MTVALPIRAPPCSIQRWFNYPAVAEGATSDRPRAPRAPRIPDNR